MEILVFPNRGCCVNIQGKFHHPRRCFLIFRNYLRPNGHLRVIGQPALVGIVVYGAIFFILIVQPIIGQRICSKDTAVHRGAICIAVIGL